MDRVEVSNYTSDYFENVKCRVTKFNRTTFVWNAEALVKFAIGDDVTVFIDIRSSHGNEYKRIVSKNLEKPFDFLKQNPTMYDNFAKYCNVPKKLELPFKPVSTLKKLHKNIVYFCLQKFYICKNYVYQPSSAETILTTAPKWRLEGTFKKNGVVIGVLVVYFSASL